MFLCLISICSRPISSMPILQLTLNDFNFLIHRSWPTLHLMIFQFRHIVCFKNTVKLFVDLGWSLNLLFYNLFFILIFHIFLTLLFFKRFRLFRQDADVFQHWSEVGPNLFLWRRLLLEYFLCNFLRHCWVEKTLDLKVIWLSFFRKLRWKETWLEQVLIVW
jgi:hypothetical protein